MKLSIRSKLIFLLLFIITTVVVLTARQTLELSLKDMSNNAKFISRNYASEISETIKERLDFLKQKTLFIVVNDDKNLNKYMFSKTPEIIATIKYKKENEKFLKQSLFINSKYEKEYLLDEKSFDEIDANINLNELQSSIDYLKVSALKAYITDVVLFGFLVNTDKNNTYLILNVIVPDVMFSTFIKEAKSKYENFLINKDGNIVYHQDSSKVNLNVSEHDVIKDFLKQDLREITKEIQKEDLKGYIASITRVANTNVSVVSKINESDAYAEAEVLKYTIFITAFFIFLISLVISIIFARTLVKPLLKLAKVTKEIAKGNFLVTVDVKSNDEIGSLAKSFETMGTELHIREEKLNEAQKALIQSEKMSAFGQISAGIAHEIKNPLTGILGHAQLIREKIIKNIEPEKYESSVEIIERETKRCKTIIENLMKFSRKEETILKPEDISKTVEDSVKLVDHQLTINGVKIKTQILKDLEPVKLSPNQIEQVLMNLMINAGHAMENEAKKELIVRVFAKDKDTARIEIQDTGKGMSEEVKKHIFEPFFTTKPSGKGTGLGLSVSYGIIESHKGKINVDSKEGEGTTFKIDLPFSHGAKIERKEEKKEVKQEETTKVEPGVQTKAEVSIPKKEEKILQTEITEEKPPVPKEETKIEPTPPVEEKPEVKLEENKTEDSKSVLDETKKEEIKDNKKEVDSDMDFDIKVPRPKRKG